MARTPGKRIWHPKNSGGARGGAGAAEVIRSLYQQEASRVRTKADASPVTEADVRAEEVIRAHR